MSGKTGMSRMQCTLICHSNSRHLQQLYTGFHILHRKKRINLVQKICLPDFSAHCDSFPLQTAHHAYLRVLINNKIRVFYDFRDSPEIDDTVLSTVDFYFKRSYAEEVVKTKSDKHKILPSGLYYSVLENRFDTYNMRRSLLEHDIKTRIKTFMLATCTNEGPGSKLFFAPRIKRFEQYPDFSATPRAIFIVRAWNPASNPARSPEKIVEIEELNLMRARCIRSLRKTFGKHFTGGFFREPYALQNFGDCLLPDTYSSKPSQYIQLLKQFPIGIATTGLHRSTGAKLAEYVAHSKAIVSETLHNQVVGDFKPEHNYLHFSSAEECTEQVARLFDNPQLRYRLMMNNYRYYHSFLRPDVLVLYSLTRAMVNPDL
jgi:hypothetical protein